MWEIEEKRNVKKQAVVLGGEMFCLQQSLCYVIFLWVNNITHSFKDTIQFTLARLCYDVVLEKELMNGLFQSTLTSE